MRISLLLSIFLFSLSLYGNSFLKQATIEPQLIQKSAKHWCPVCGLSIKDNYKTSYTANLKVNGTLRQYCSIHCMVQDMTEYGLETKSIQVLDMTTEKYIDVQKAFYVVGSDIYGTNSKISKLAFKDKIEAQNFVNKYGGKVVSYETALASAKESFEADKKFFKKIKMKKNYLRGKNIAQKVCKLESLDMEDFLEIGELKSAIVTQNLCNSLQENELHDLALYLWEIKRFGTLEQASSKIEVREDEKCPVCGMFTYKYPRWAAQIFYEKDGKKVHYSFDGVKDLMKFYFDSAKWGNYPLAIKENIKKILVTDYYTSKGIEGREAFYVIRSDIYGPMGHEFIPFENKEDAETFLQEHFGKKILSFRDVTEKQTYALDYSE